MSCSQVTDQRDYVVHYADTPLEAQDKAKSLSSLSDSLVTSHVGEVCAYSSYMSYVSHHLILIPLCKVYYYTYVTASSLLVSLLRDTSLSFYPIGRNNGIANTPRQILHCVKSWLVGIGLVVNWSNFCPPPNSLWLL